MSVYLFNLFEFFKHGVKVNDIYNNEHEGDGRYRLLSVHSHTENGVTTLLYILYKGADGEC